MMLSKQVVGKTKGCATLNCLSYLTFSLICLRPPTRRNKLSWSDYLHTVSGNWSITRGYHTHKTKNYFSTTSWEDDDVSFVRRARHKTWVQVVQAISKCQLTEQLSMWQELQRSSSELNCLNLWCYPNRWSERQKVVRPWTALAT